MREISQFKDKVGKQGGREDLVREGSNQERKLKYSVFEWKVF